MIKSTIRKIINWANSDDRERPIPASINHPYTSTKSNRGISASNGLNFTVYPATGGKVISMNSYNLATDREHNSLYVITDKDDLGEELGQIITRECLTR